MQIRHEGPEWSALHLKLRIQKDRLLAWGLEWSDATAAQAVVLDGSLDRAGISDLVTSIMSSIRQLLDEAEALQSPLIYESPTTYGDIKPRTSRATSSKWTKDSMKRLEGILKDLTISIDTLCDLSRPRVEDWEKRDSHLKKDYINRVGSSHVQSDFSISRNAKSLVFASEEGSVLLPQKGSSVSSSHIDPNRIRLESNPTTQSDSLPPSYESVAIGLGHRELGFLSSPETKLRTGSSTPIQDGDHVSNRTEEVLVLLDYLQEGLSKQCDSLRLDEDRYQELFVALEKLAPKEKHDYCGVLRLEGWTKALERACYAFVYEIPSLSNGQTLLLQPRSLLSFLQNGADTNGANMPSLENRFRLALNIASKVLQLHELGVTHRNITSNNVVFLLDRASDSEHDKPWKGSILRSPYLTGFHQQSSIAPDTNDRELFSNMHYHPNIGDGRPHSYTKNHDYYSLGLILLEIGIWMPIAKFWKSKYSRKDFKLRLQDIYLNKLSAKCGTRYMQVVLYCMTAADHLASPINSSRPRIHNPSTITSFSLAVQSLQRCCLIDNDQRENVQSSQLPVMPCLSGNISIQQNLAPGSTEPGQSLARAPRQQKENTRKVELSQKRSSRHEAHHALPSKPKLQAWSHELPPLYTKYWTSTMFPKLEKILSRAISRWESYTIDLMMCGKDPESARPTIYLECTSTEKIRKILRHLNKELRLFEIKVVSGHIVRSKAGKKKRKKALKTSREALGATTDVESVTDYEPSNPFYHQLPSCGASIGACNNDKHLPPVTFGGAILVDGESYGMSVHHMLEDDEEIDFGLSDNIDLQRSIAPNSNTPDNLRAEHLSDYASDDEEDDDMSQCYQASECSSNGETPGIPPYQPLYPFEISEDDDDEEISPEDGDEFWLSADFESEVAEPKVGEYLDDEMEMEMGDTFGISVGCGQHLTVTQPAIDDVSNEFFSTEEDKDEEHLSSHSFGHIHASSGIRRSRQNNIVHEIDWALIKINECRMQSKNTIVGGGRFCKSTVTASSPPNSSENQPSFIPNSYPCNVMKADDLGGLEVHAFGRTSGLQIGTILPAMRTVRMPGRSFASHSWHVKGNFGGMYSYSNTGNYERQCQTISFISSLLNTLTFIFYIK